MKLASYIASEGRLLDRLIALRHWGKYSHSELVFSDDVAFSSSFRDGGVRFKEIEFEPAKWDFVELPIGSWHENYIRRWCEKREFRSDGKRRSYDWPGVFAFVNPLRREDPEKDFCSETCLMAIQSTGFLSDYTAYKCWPTRLHEICLRWKFAGDDTPKAA